MNQGRTVFSQLVEFLPTYQFQICVERYQGNRYVKDFSCWDQFLCLAFAQLTYRESLRDIEVIYCLRSKLESSRMAPKQRPKIEIKKTHRGPLLSFNQAVTVDCSDFLGTALISAHKNDRYFRSDCLNFARRCYTTHAIHHDIENDHLWRGPAN